MAMNFKDDNGACFFCKRVYKGEHDCEVLNELSEKLLKVFRKYKNQKRLKDAEARARLDDHKFHSRPIGSIPLIETGRVRCSWD